MCTLIALWQCHPSAPLVLALNRDEYLDRPTESPTLWDGAAPEERIVAGRDQLSGGTWFGVGRNIVAALTNHHSETPVGPRERSRGELVVRALRQPDLKAVHEELSSIPAESYGLFHLLVADRSEMAWLTNRSGSLEFTRVEAGLHILGNHGLDDENDPVVMTMRREMAGAVQLDRPDLERHLRTVLSGHGSGQPCVHRGSFGTRSSAILFWNDAESALWTTDGPPCETPWEDRRELLAKIHV